MSYAAMLPLIVRTRSKTIHPISLIADRAVAIPHKVADGSSNCEMVKFEVVSKVLGYKPCW